MTDRPKLYPNHQHHWADPLDVNRSTAPGQTSTLVRCTVCGFTAPRNLAGLDGLQDGEPIGGPRAKIWWQAEVDTDIRCTHQDAAGQCLDHQGHAGDHQPPQPEQETR